MIPLIESPLPQLNEVSFAAFAPLPAEFGERDRQKLAIGVRVLGDGTQEYSRRTVFDLTEGRTIQATLLPDGVLIRFAVPKASLTNGVALMEGLLRRPTVTQESLDAALRRVQRGEPDLFNAALKPRRNALKTVKADEAKAILRRVFNPKSTVVAVSGGFVAGEARSRWMERTADWKPSVEPHYPDISVAPDPTQGPEGITAVELRGRPFPASDPALPARWLALIALGVGKGSSLFRDVRQAEGWTYRQEAVLWPDRAGLLPRLIALTAPHETEAGRAEGLRSTLVKSIEGWTEGDRTRALGAASLGLGPLWLVDSPVTNAPLERASLDAYWFSKAGRTWDFDALIEAMRAVPLETLKSEGMTLVREAHPLVLPGRG